MIALAQCNLLTKSMVSYSMVIFFLTYGNLSRNITCRMKLCFLQHINIFCELLTPLYSFSCDQAALITPLSVRLSVCQSVCLSVCHTSFTMFLSSYHHEVFWWIKWSYYLWHGSIYVGFVSYFRFVCDDCYAVIYCDEPHQTIYYVHILQTEKGLMCSLSLPNCYFSGDNDTQPISSIY